jgi:hypothetical protein
VSNEKQYDVRDSIEHDILKTYQYGSRVYGCHTDDSDYDYITVVKSDEDLYYSVEYSNTNFTVYSESMFIKKIKEHHISVLECIFQSKNDPYLRHFELDKSVLRRSISAVASNSFVKCKKKLKQGDVYIGKKSMFHSLRILGFGIQIALTGKIVDYSAYNHFMDRIREMDSTNWRAYESIFRPVYNNYKTNFRIFAPLESDV